MKESEIRKKEVLNKYLDLVKKDSKTFFGADDFIEISCPACRSRNYLFEFKKMDFSYVICRECSTLFVNPRPRFEAINEFYSRSPSTSFWINEFFKPMAEARREKIFRSRADYISKALNLNHGCTIGDIGAGFGLFLEELRGIMPGNRYIAVEPSEEMAGICRGKGLEAKCTPFENLNEMEEGFDLLTAFELVEHLFDPEVFFKKVFSLLKPGGYFFMTTLNSRGFDISLLWENSKSVTPPHHLNFFNTESIRIILERLDFEIMEISTPGELDWDIVEDMIKKEGISIGRLWETLAFKGSEDSKRLLQEWIVKSNLSSHMRVLAKKS